MGDFDENFLELPRAVLEVVMKKHQRYFPIEDPSGEKLLPHFITVANGKLDNKAVQIGNQKVLRARYDDARFY